MENIKNGTGASCAAERRALLGLVQVFQTGVDPLLEAAQFGAPIFLQIVEAAVKLTGQVGEAGVDLEGGEDYGQGWNRASEDLCEVAVHDRRIRLLIIHN